MLRLIVILTWLVALATPAFAEDRALAERHFRLGEKAYQAQDFETAAAQFEEAYKHFELPEIAFSAAQAYRRLYRIKPKPADVARAVELYRIYLSKVTTGGRVADAADALSEMQHELERLIASGANVTPELAKQHTRLSIAVLFDNESVGSGGAEMREVGEERVAPPVEVEALLDGQPVNAPALLNVTPGVHTVRVTAPGYLPAETTVTVPQGTLQSAEVRLIPKPARVTLTTERGVRVSVNGRLAGTAPLAALELPAGKHVVTLSMRGRVPVARELVLERGSELALRQPLEKTGRRKAVPWLLGGAGVAAAATGVAVTLTFLRDRDARDLLSDFREFGGASEADRARYEDLRVSRDRWRTAAYVGAAGIGVLAGLAAILYYTDEPRTDGIRVEPVTVPAGGGAAIAGRF